MRLMSIKAMYAYFLNRNTACQLPDGGTIANVGGIYRFMDRDGEAYRDEPDMRVALALVERMVNEWVNI